MSEHIIKKQRRCGAARAKMAARSCIVAVTLRGFGTWARIIRCASFGAPYSSCKYLRIDREDETQACLLWGLSSVWSHWLSSAVWLFARSCGRASLPAMVMSLRQTRLLLWSLFGPLTHCARAAASRGPRVAVLGVPVISARLRGLARPLPYRTIYADVHPCGFSNPQGTCFLFRT